MAKLLECPRELLLRAKEGDHAMRGCDGSLDGLSGCKRNTEAMKGEDVPRQVIDSRLKCMRDGFAQLTHRILKIGEAQPGHVLPIEARIGE